MYTSCVGAYTSLIPGHANAHMGAKHIQPRGPRIAAGNWRISLVATWARSLSQFTQNSQGGNAPIK